MKDTILLSLKMIVGEYILKYDSLETSEFPEFQAKLSLFCQSNDLSNFVATCMCGIICQHKMGFREALT